jgi:hypothetical protein
MAKREPEFQLDSNGALIGFPDSRVENQLSLMTREYHLRYNGILIAIANYRKDNARFICSGSPEHQSVVQVFHKQAGFKRFYDDLCTLKTSFYEAYEDILEPAQTLNDIF